MHCNTAILHYWGSARFCSVHTAKIAAISKILHLGYRALYKMQSLLIFLYFTYLQLFVHLAVKMVAPVLGLTSVHVLKALKEPNVRLTLMNVHYQNFINVPQIPFVSTNQDGKWLNTLYYYVCSICTMKRYIMIYRVTFNIENYKPKAWPGKMDTKVST